MPVRFTVNFDLQNIPLNPLCCEEIFGDVNDLVCPLLLNEQFQPLLHHHHHRKNSRSTAPFFRLLLYAFISACCCCCCCSCSCKYHLLLLLHIPPPANTTSYASPTESSPSGRSGNAAAHARWMGDVVLDQ